MSGQPDLQNIGHWSEADFIAHGRSIGLPEIPPTFMPELITKRCDITDAELRIIVYQEAGRDLSRGIARHGEMLAGGKIDYAGDDSRLRAWIWYEAAALRLMDKAQAYGTALEPSVAVFLHHAWAPRWVPGSDQHAALAAESAAEVAA